MRFSLLVIGGLILFVTLGPLLISTDPMTTSAAAQFQPPSREHVLGTDLFGRDILARFIYGGQRTLMMAGGATVLALGAGVPLGLIAGSTSGWINQALSGVLAAMLSIPSLLLALVFITLSGPSIIAIMLAVGLAQVTPCAYAIRAAVQSVRQMLYVEAARSMGGAAHYILAVHVLRGIRPTLLAYACVIFSYALLNGAALSFLGLAGEPGVPDWGVMLADGRAAFRFAPWISIVPGLGITLTVWAINRLADAIMERK